MFIQFVLNENQEAFNTSEHIRLRFYFKQQNFTFSSSLRFRAGTEQLVPHKSAQESFGASRLLQRGVQLPRERSCFHKRQVRLRTVGTV